MKTIKTRTRTVPATAWVLWTLGAALLSALIVGGCGSGNHAGIEEPVLTRTRSVTTANGLLVTFTEDADSIKIGQSVNYTLTVTNTTNAAITYYTRNDCSLQLLPDVDSGVTVTNTSSQAAVVVGQPEVTCAFIGLLESKELAPGASISGSINSSPSYGAHALTGAGTYEATATIVASFTSGNPTAQAVTVGALPVTVTE